MRDKPNISSTGPSTPPSRIVPDSHSHCDAGSRGEAPIPRQPHERQPQTASQVQQTREQHRREAIRKQLGERRAGPEQQRGAQRGED
jgi:hypothetical protein